MGVPFDVPERVSTTVLPSHPHWMVNAAPISPEVKPCPSLIKEHEGGTVHTGGFGVGPGVAGITSWLQRLPAEGAPGAHPS